jgi:hypothetical protein
MYDIVRGEQGENIIVSDVPGAGLAEGIAKGIAEEFGDSTVKAVEQ